jgi:hypothetical protein
VPRRWLVKKRRGERRKATETDGARRRRRDPEARKADAREVVGRSTGSPERRWSKFYGTAPNKSRGPRNISRGLLGDGECPMSECAALSRRVTNTQISPRISQQRPPTVSRGPARPERRVFANRASQLAGTWRRSPTPSAPVNFCGRGESFTVPGRASAAISQWR